MEPLCQEGISFTHLYPFNIEGTINDLYDYVEFIGRGSSSSVYKVRHKKSRKIYAAKDFGAITFDRDENFYHEISCLCQLDHENVVKLISVVIGSDQQNMYMILEYCQTNLADVIENGVILKELEIKTLMSMLFNGLLYLHNKHIIHGDINPTNLLLSSGTLKIADFGSSVNYVKNENSLNPNVGTRWYRAPELLFGSKTYTTSIDIWAAACIFGELLIGKPLFPGKCDIEQISLIVDFLGMPNDELMPGFSVLQLAKDFNFICNKTSDLYNTVFHNVSAGAIKLLKQLLIYNFNERLDASSSLLCSYFEEDPLPTNSINALCV